MLKQVRSRARTLLQRASYGQAETDLDAALSRLDALRLALRRKVFSRALILSAVIALLLCVVVLTGSYLELGYVIRYLSLAGLSVVGMAGAWLFGGSCVLALLWLGLYLRNLDAEGGVHRFRCQRVLTLANRSVGHVEVLLSGWLLVCMNTTRASLQLVALGCLLLAPAGFDFVVLRQVGARLRGNTTGTCCGCGAPTFTQPRWQPWAPSAYKAATGRSLGGRLYYGHWRSAYDFWLGWYGCKSHGRVPNDVGTRRVRPTATSGCGPSSALRKRGGHGGGTRCWSRWAS